MGFSDDDKERVRAATSIADLISGVTTVKRSGRTHMAICPFHQEKTPSMSVDVARGLYYCHGCHASGDIFTFVQETQGLTFPEALEFLAERAGIVLEQDPEAARRRGERQRLVEAVRRAVDFYHRRLMKSEDAGSARAYLRGRDYGAEVVEEFKLGYAPPGGDALVRELRAGGIDDRTMVDAGLARRGRGGALYDEFQDRVLFPITDVRGDPVGFGGRILGEGGPKYRNTPETRIYKKSRLLYGLDRARHHIGRFGYAVVVEGYTDVIALHRAELPVAVATCGTALGEDHFDLLRRFTDRIVLSFDADAAGARAALSGDTLETPVRLDLDLRVAEMPPGGDPADLVQQGKAAELRESIERAKPLLQFRIERELEEYDLSEPESRARALRALAPRVAKVEDAIARTEYARFLASRMQVDLRTVEEAMGIAPRRPASIAAPATVATTGRARLERELLRSVLAGGSPDGVGAADFTDDELRAAFERIAPALAAGTAPGAPVPLPSPRDGIDELLVRLAVDERPVAEVAELSRRLRIFDLERRIAELRAEVSALPPAEQPASAAFGELVRLQGEKRQLEVS